MENNEVKTGNWLNKETEEKLDKMWIEHIMACLAIINRLMELDN